MFGRILWFIIRHLTVWPFVAAWGLYNFFAHGRSVEIVFGWGTFIALSGIMILMYFLGIMWHTNSMVIRTLRMADMSVQLSKELEHARSIQEETEPSRDSE